jgi:endonuclease/exonuclease/phosphatase family metal-dependent hydrolase
VRVVAGLDADVVVVSEAFRADDGRALLAPLEDAGYRVETLDFMYLKDRRSRARVRDAIPSVGMWQLAICSRFPVTATRAVPLGHFPFDAVGTRHALACSIDVGDASLEVVGLHTSSRFYLGASLFHLLGLRRAIDAGTLRADIIAGDFNLWGPPVSAVFRGWRRAVRGPTYPAYRPHSQIDHIVVRDGIEVLGGEVLAATPSDHRPVRARLRTQDRAGARVT